MKLISSNSDEDLERNRLKEEVAWAACDLASNVIRVVRGAGKPYELVAQAAKFVELSSLFRDSAGVWPYPEIAQALALPRHDRRRGDEADYLIDLGTQKAIKGALQAAASELVGQRTQVTAGESELFDGIDLVERGRDINRAKRTSFSGRSKAKPKRK